MEYLLEILKIVEGALSADQTKVTAYTDLLAKKLETNGEKVLADKLRRTLNNTKYQQLNATRFTPSNRLPVDNESRLSLGQEEHLLPLDVPIFLERSAQKQVQEFLSCVKAADQLIAKGVDITPSLLLYGSPGCGKTQLARHIAALSELPLITARLDSMISSYLGSTAKNLRNLFEHAGSRPCALFLDEFDALAKLRDDQYELGELKRVVVSLLQNIDSLDSHTVLIAATNHEHLLDPAVWRRFTFKIEMTKPSFEIRKEMFSFYLKDYLAPSQSKSDTLAMVSEGLSGDEIRIISQNSKRNAILNQETKVDEEDVLWRVLETRGLLSNSDDKEKNIRVVRNICPKAFTYQRLSKLFDCSTGYISNIINSAREENG